MSSLRINQSDDEDCHHFMQEQSDCKYKQGLTRLVDNGSSKTFL